jgi:S-layer family protein
MSSRRLAIVGLLWLAVSTQCLLSQPLPQWGTQATSVYTVGAYEFHPYNVAQGPLTTNGNGSNRRTTALPGPVGAPYDAAVHLPSGAVVTGLRLVACPSIPSYVEAHVFACDDLNCQDKGYVVLGPGVSCSTSTNAVTPFNIDNGARSYVVSVILFENVSAFSAVKIEYHLQVSPAPAAATFNDVPTTHVFFQYIEALAAAGITGGCGNNNYCPNDLMTRGQMAVFLARALGLHFAN